MRAGDQLDGIESGLIHSFRDRQHHARGHVLGPQTLVPVTDCRIDEFNSVLFHGCRLAENHGIPKCTKAKLSTSSFQHGVLESRLTWTSPEASLRIWMPAIHAGMT